MINKQTTSRFSFDASGNALNSAVAGHSNSGGSGFGGEQGAPEIWQAVREQLRGQLGDTRFDNWIARLQFVAEVDGEILISAASELERDRVNKDFAHLIQQAWSSADPAGRRIRVEARECIAPEILALAKPAANGVSRGAAGKSALGGAADGASGDGASQTLDSFLAGDSNQVAHGIARRIAQGQNVAAQIVTIVGPHGVGKSHIAHGVEHALVASGREDVLYLSAEDFLVSYVEGVKRGDTSEQRTRMRKTRVLMLDDFQFICSRPGTLLEFFSHVRAIIASGGLVILTCDQAPAALEQLDDRMRDEIQGGVVARIDLPEPALRRQIVRAKAEEIRAANPDFVLEDEWIELLAERLPASGRVLQGAVRNIFVGTILAEQPLTRAAVEKAVQLALGGAVLRPPKIDTIKDVTAKTYSISKHDLESECRKRQFARPRQFAMYLARKMTNCSYPQIGRMFGDRDHTTVLFAYRKISALVKADTSAAEELRQLEQRIQSDPRNLRGA
ncbi:MAG: DnaA/Hda family protein [Hyphomonadaceae bacterium]